MRQFIKETLIKLKVENDKLDRLSNCFNKEYTDFDFCFSQMGNVYNQLALELISKLFKKHEYALEELEYFAYEVPIMKEGLIVFNGKEYRFDKDNIDAFLDYFLETNELKD